jgi:hypothetical protein
VEWSLGYARVSAACVPAPAPARQLFLLLRSTFFYCVLQGATLAWPHIRGTGRGYPRSERLKGSASGSASHSPSPSPATLTPSAQYTHGLKGMRRPVIAAGRGSKDGSSLERKLCHMQSYVCRMGDLSQDLPSIQPLPSLEIRPSPGLRKSSLRS